VPRIAEVEGGRRAYDRGACDANPHHPQARAAELHESRAQGRTRSARVAPFRRSVLVRTLHLRSVMQWEEEILGGSHWSGVLRRGSQLRLIARGDDANLAALFYNREQPLERYNMADTLKAQHTAHLTTGCVCYSDMGRILCSITADTCGWHDPLCGLTDDATIAAQYGATSFQAQRNARFVSGRQAMLVELGKYGLGERDLVANINFFSKLLVDDDGAMRLATGHSRAGDYVDLRFEMDTLVLLHAGPHPLATGGTYAPPGIGLQVSRAAPVAADDACRVRCPENSRGFINTERYCA
jgi:urea carboxylase-associated protein 2